MLNAQIPLQAQGVTMEPQQNALMRILQMDQQQQANALLRMQMQAHQQQQQERAQAQQNALQQQQSARGYLDATSNANGPAMPFDPGQALARGLPMEWVKMLNEQRNPQPKAPILSGPGQIARDPVTGAVAWQNPAAPKEDPFLDQLRAAGIDPASPKGRALLAGRVEKQATHAPASSATVVLPAQEKEESKAVGKYFGEQYGEVQKSGLAAGQTISRLTQLRNLADGLNTGKLAPVGAEVAAYAQSVGLNIDPKLGNKQALESASNEFALQLRNPSGGAGMPGAMSDADRQFLVKMAPSLSKTPEGNRLIIDARIKLAQRDQQVAKMARDYRQRRGTLDEGFYNELQAFSDANPMFSATTAADIGSGTSPAFTDPAKQKRYEAWKAQQR